MNAAMATFGQLKAAGGGVGPGALRVLGQLAKAGLSGDAQHRKGTSGLESQLPPVDSLPQEDIDRLESSVPGGSTHAVVQSQGCHRQPL